MGKYRTKGSIALIITGSVLILNDLGIVESTYGEKTLFSLFDMTESDGGKRCLEEWLVHPLSDWKALHERQEAIRYPDFPEIRICREELDFIEFYLSQGDQPGREFRHMICKSFQLQQNVFKQLRSPTDDITLGSSPEMPEDI